MGKTIGNAKVCFGLIFKVTDYIERQLQPTIGEKVSLSVFNYNKNNDVMLWHYRLGHPSFLYLKKIFPSLFTKSLNGFHCEICQLSKHVCKPYFIQPYKPSHSFSMIHSDVWGPSKIKNITRTRWFMSFIYDHSRISWIFLMKEKLEVGQIFKQIYNMIQTQFHAKIQVLKTNNARDYFNSILREILLK